MRDVLYNVLYGALATLWLGLLLFFMVVSAMELIELASLPISVTPLYHVGGIFAVVVVAIIFMGSLFELIREAKQRKR